MRRVCTAVVSLALAACGGRSALDGAGGGVAAGGAGQGGAGGAAATGGGGGAIATATGGAGGVGPTVCGDGVLDPGEDCDLGLDNRDAPAIVLEQAGLVLPVMPLDRPGDASLFYTYQNGSGHTLLERAGESRLFLYRDTTTGVLSLFASHGIDPITSGEDQPEGRVTLDFSGLPEATFVSVADDDASELSKTSATTARGTWYFLHSADGGALSGLPLPGAWSVTIVPTIEQGIDRFVFIDAEESRHDLSTTDPITITAPATPSACRTDCTLPFCGDGRVDAGEACDDGNTTGGDGCAADCKTLD